MQQTSFLNSQESKWCSITHRFYKLLYPGLKILSSNRANSYQGKSCEHPANKGHEHFCPKLYSSLRIRLGLYQTLNKCWVNASCESTSWFQLQGTVNEWRNCSLHWSSYMEPTLICKYEAESVPISFLFVKSQFRKNFNTFILKNDVLLFFLLVSMVSPNAQGKVPEHTLKSRLSSSSRSCQYNSPAMCCTTLPHALSGLALKVFFYSLKFSFL